MLRLRDLRWKSVSRDSEERGIGVPKDTKRETLVLASVAWF